VLPETQVFLAVEGVGGGQVRRSFILKVAQASITERPASSNLTPARLGETDSNRKTGDSDRPIRYRNSTTFGRRVMGFGGDNAAVIEAMTSRRVVSARRCLSKFFAVPQKSTIWVP